MGANREYKNSVFSWLFSDPNTLRELYCALKDVTLSPDLPITINTLEGVLFKGRMNDISFAIGGKVVVLVEHQSTINDNMPLRMLLYIAKVYEKTAGEKDIYREKRIPLPLPEFIVLYNGTAPYPEEKTLKLSEAFPDPGELGLSKSDMVSLELVVKVYNINQGHNGAILKRCKTLEGYSAFIAKVRGYEQEAKNRDEAMRLAVKDCIEQGILKDFLENHTGEVIDMLMTEWNWDDAKEVWFEEGMEEGLEKGLVKGREEGLEEGQNLVLELMQQGYTAEQIKTKLAGINSDRAETSEENL